MNERNFKKSTSSFKQFGAGFLLVAFSLQTFSLATAAQFVSNREMEKKATEMRLDEAFDSEVINQVAPSKIAPDLVEKTDEFLYGYRAEETQTVIIQLKSATPLDEMLSDPAIEADQQQMFAREVGNNKAKGKFLKSELAALNGRFKKSYNKVGLVSAELPLSKIMEFSQSENVELKNAHRSFAKAGFKNTDCCQTIFV